jgi:hypothetical protein
MDTKIALTPFKSIAILPWQPNSPTRPLAAAAAELLDWISLRMSVLKANVVPLPVLLRILAQNTGYFGSKVHYTLLAITCIHQSPKRSTPFPISHPLKPMSITIWGSTVDFIICASCIRCVRSGSMGLRLTAQLWKMSLKLVTSFVQVRPGYLAFFFDNWINFCQSWMRRCRFCALIPTTI